MDAAGIEQDPGSPHTEREVCFMTGSMRMTYRWSLHILALYFIFVVLLLLPHVFTVINQQSNSSIYSPAVLNSNWTRFDDIVKLYPSWQFAINFSLRGKLGVPDINPSVYPNVIQESVVVVPNAVAIWLTGSLLAPFVLAILFAGASGVFA